MASSSSSSCNQFRYDVFLSFKGEDTRNGFTSHLYAALCRKSINTFIDNDLVRGEEIAPALLKTIEESKIAVVIFSKNYAASKWCLDELSKIIQCHQNRGKLVVPVFYQVDPSDVRKQTGNFGNAFAKHEKVQMQKVQIWKAALRTAANLSGWASQDIGLESKLVDEISKDIFKKLNQTSSHCLERLAGMDSRIKHMMDLLSLGSSDVRMVGIWGMGGIGKTTIATTIFQQIKCDFDGACFLQNVRENSEQCDGLTSLARKLVLETLGERDFKISIPENGIQTMLRGLKVLIILDDVNKIRQLEVLAGDPYWFGSGSRIIITSRDKQVFRRWTNNLYQVNELMYSDALQFFSWNAFKQDHPTEGLMVESNLLVKYANGNPLALKVLGSSLFEKSKEEWRSAVKKLQNIPHGDIQDVLKLSYRYLDSHDKQIFLHISCFFKGEVEERVVKFLDSCGFSSKIGISNLIDKSLVTNMHGELRMPDLVQQVGRAIVHEESSDPNKRSRLWEHQDIYQIFRRNTGSEAIEGISLDMSQLTKELYLEPDAFAKMPNLKLIKFYAPPNSEDFQRDHYKVKLGQGLESLPNDLRYLEWHGYPLKTLPANIDPEGLIQLCLPNSAVERLWDGNKNSEKLIRNKSSRSRSPIKALTSVGNTVFEGLYKVISGISHLRSLACMRMENSKTIQRLPDDFVLPNLEILDLLGCSKLKKFPLVSRNIKNLRLSKTAIVEVPSSIECLGKLQWLYMLDCNKLKNLPNNIYKLKSLEVLNLNGCSNLKNFPDILEAMKHLVLLGLERTAIEILPPSVEHLTRLQRLYLNDCKSLVYLPESLSKLGDLHYLRLSGCSKLELLCKDNHNLRAQEDFIENRFLLFQNCLDLACLSCLRFLDLSGLDFEQLPRDINQAFRLQYLRLSECKRLRSLLELPLSLKNIRLDNCSSLETVTALKAIFESPQNASFDKDDQGERYQFFILSNCHKLNHSSWSVSESQTQQKMQRFATAAAQSKKDDGRRGRIEICYPGSEIPNWMTYKMQGSSIRIQVQANWKMHRFLGFAFCVVVESSKRYDWPRWPIVICELHFRSTYGGHSEDRTFRKSIQCINLEYKSEHVLLWHDSTWDAGLDRFALEQLDMLVGKQRPEMSFTFTGHANRCKVKKCGVLPLFAEDESKLSGRGGKEQEEAISDDKRCRGRSDNIASSNSKNKRCRGWDDNIASGETEKDEEVPVLCLKKRKQDMGIALQPSYHMEDD